GRWALGLLVLFVTACGAAKPVIEPVPVGAPHFPEFVVPTVPPNMAPEQVVDQQTRAWLFLQGGDTRAADREVGVLLKAVPTFYPAEAGLGYSALARKDAQTAVGHFDKVLAANPSYAPALAGKGDALLQLGRASAALGAFQAALTADPSLTA